jgi:ATP-dependent DNA helicase RecG
VIETLVAFANTSGGTVYVGIDDAGQLKGIDLGKETIQKWMNEIKIKTQPAIIPTIQVHTIDSIQFVTIEVQEFPVKPLSFKGRY